MPTYLTPGVYVEEIPSANKPIEGVGTAVAAFVGLAPGGPVNTAMRISNWSQFARLYGDPQTAEKPRAALPAATDRGVEALRAVALEGAPEPVSVEIVEDPSVAEESEKEG